MTTPAYQWRFLTAEQRADIAKRATTPPAATVPDDAMQAAWEADLAAHMALRDAAKTAEAKKPHDAAIKTLTAALTKAAARR